MATNISDSKPSGKDISNVSEEHLRHRLLLFTDAEEKMQYLKNSKGQFYSPIYS